MLSLKEVISKLILYGDGLIRSRVVETEGRFGLRDGDLAGDLGNVLVEFSPHIVVVTEDECLLQLETDGDNIFGVLLRKSVGLIDF
jgi:hypothetical protein